MPKVLSLNQVRQYEDEGIVFPIQALSANEVAPARSALEEYRDRLGPNPGYGRFRHLHLHLRWAYDLATHPRILDAVEDVLGPNILIHSSTVFYKSPRDSSYVSWHQDGYYWQLTVPQLTTAWVALTDSLVENGCVRVIPGSHKLGRLAHTEAAVAGSNMLTSGLQIAGAVDDSQARDVTLSAGQMSLHHVDLIHGSNPNRSDQARIGMAVRFVAPPVKQALAHHPVVLARGRDDYHHFELLREPPAGSLEEGIAAQAELARWVLKVRGAGNVRE
jgi:hypothetical protein